MRAKGESWSQVLLVEIVETEDGNCYQLSQRHALFCEESLGKIDAGIELSGNGSIHEFYCLKALITLEQVNASLKTSMEKL